MKHGFLSKIIILSFSVFVFATQASAQKMNIDSIANIVISELDSAHQIRINELTRFDINLILRPSQGRSIELKNPCWKYKTFRKFRRCMRFVN